MSTENQNCESKVKGALESRLDDLRLLWAGYCQDDCPECEGTGEKIIKGINGDDIEDSCRLCEGTGKLSEDIPDVGSLNEYGLSWDYVAPYTFKGQSEGYFRYQISWGGPSEEFRIDAHKNGSRWIIDSIEFWYLDWFDGAHRDLYGDDYDLMESILGGYFLECSGDHTYNEAMKDYDPCEYLGECRGCGEEYEFESSSADNSKEFCSATCEFEFEDDSEDNTETED